LVEKALSRKPCGNETVCNASLGLSFLGEKTPETTAFEAYDFMLHE
jgi:hypothetical protein